MIDSMKANRMTIRHTRLFCAAGGLGPQQEDGGGV